MKITIKLNSEEWLFARLYAYADMQMSPYVYQKNVFKKKLEHEPKPKQKIPYLILDEAGLLINQNNIKGEWIRWDWEDTRSIRIYKLMHPWKASVYQLRHDCDLYRERRKEKRYFRHMNWKYKDFCYQYLEHFQNEYSIILEGKNKNAQFWLPTSWILKKDFSWFMDHMENCAGKEIKFFNTDDRWNLMLNSSDIE